MNFVGCDLIHPLGRLSGASRLVVHVLLRLGWPLHGVQTVLPVQMLQWAPRAMAPVDRAAFGKSLGTAYIYRHIQTRARKVWTHLTKINLPTLGIGINTRALIECVVFPFTQNTEVIMLEAWATRRNHGASRMRRNFPVSCTTVCFHLTHVSNQKQEHGPTKTRSF